MSRLPILLTLAFLGFFGSLARATPKPNILLICIDDLRPELKSFGAEYIHSPNIDALAARGRAFHRHYVQAPTCGASRYALLTGQYGPAGNKALFTRAKKITSPSLPAYFRQNGYTTLSIGKVSHHPGGRGGKNWDDDAQLEMPNSWDLHSLLAPPWKHPRGAMHGLANGHIREKSKPMPIFESHDGSDHVYPDGYITEEALSRLAMMSASDKPFFMAVGLIRPHLPFGAPAKYLKHYQKAQLPPIPHPDKPNGQTTWHRSGEFMGYHRRGKNPNDDASFALEVRKHYAACVSYADAQVGKIVTQLEALGLAKNTLIILWGDHGWHLGEHAIWGKHSLFEESLRSPLIVVAPEVKQVGEKTNAIVQTIDLFPTLCDLVELPKPEFLNGHSLLPQLQNPNAESKGVAISYTSKARTIRTKTHRLIAHKDGFVELYNHDETKNLAPENDVLVKELLKQLKQSADRQ